MKEIIIKVLKSFADLQVNLESESARDIIASEIELDLIKNNVNLSIDSLEQICEDKDSDDCCGGNCHQ